MRRRTAVRHKRRRAVTCVLTSRTGRMGEVCSNGTRLLVHNDIRQEFVRRLCKKAAGIRPGDPMDPSTVH